MTETQTTETTPLLLQHLTQRAISAHNWTSFSPEKKGHSLIKEFSAELESDIVELEKLGCTTVEVTTYAAKFESLFTQWLGAKSRCASSMIAGPSNFPVRRAEKANNAEHGAYVRLTEWRKAVINGYGKRARKIAVINAGGELKIAKRNLDSMRKSQEVMKACNAVIRKAKGTDCTEALLAAGLSESNARKIQLPDYCGRIGFASFNLTNNLANIKRTEERIKELERREQFKEATAQTDFTFEGGRVEVAAADDRFRVYHDTKPEQSKIDLLKRNGFKWSPFNKCWQRQITENARRAVQIVTGVEIK